jgi:hypothetical protein
LRVQPFVALAQAKKVTPPKRSNDEIRGLILQYFYDRNSTATSAMGTKGAAVKISAARKELKERYGLSLQEVRSNLTYLISEGWCEELQVQKSVPLKAGTIIPQVTPFYRITARGIDKIEGPSEYTIKKFHDIKIEATGQKRQPNEREVPGGRGGIGRISRSSHVQRQALHGILSPLWQ